MFNSKDPEAYELCPYDPSHQVFKYRMSKHLGRCTARGNQIQNAVMVTCIFNSNHRVPEIELRYHIDSCPDRIKLDKDVYRTDQVEDGKYPVSNAEVSLDEAWGETSHTYQPDEYCKQNVVLRQAKVESAAVKKNFREEEKQRIQQLKSADAIPTDNLYDEARSKFRSMALANTTTNVKEESPYLYEDLTRIIKLGPPKPIIADVNCKLASRQSNLENATVVKSEEAAEAEAPGVSSDFPRALSSNSSDTKENVDKDGFTKAKPKKKVGGGRGRGINR